jgi:hypothetical protein
MVDGISIIGIVLWIASIKYKYNLILSSLKEQLLNILKDANKYLNRLVSKLKI